MNPKEQLKAALAAKDIQVEAQKREREEKLIEEKNRSRAHTEQYVKAVVKLNEQITEWVDGLDFEIEAEPVSIPEGAKFYDVMGLTLFRAGQSLSFKPQGKTTGEFLGTIKVQPRKNMQGGSLSLGLASTNNDGTGNWFLIVSFNGNSNELLFGEERFYDLLKTTFA